jgi:hypothetical protein
MTLFFLLPQILAAVVWGITVTGVKEGCWYLSNLLGVTQPWQERQ